MSALTGFGEHSLITSTTMAPAAQEFGGARVLQILKRLTVTNAMRSRFFPPARNGR